MRILSTICARGGSRGIKNKNIRPLLNKPLIAHTIEQVKAWGKADRIVCSSDSEEIKRIARQYGAETPFTRPEKLSGDTVLKKYVVRHCLNFCEKENNIKYDYILDLDCTSPLRLVSDIERAFNQLHNSDADLLISAYKADRNPYFNMVEFDDKGFLHLCKRPKVPIVARQQAPLVMALNASFYFYRRKFLLKECDVMDGKVIIYEMPDTSIDIDREIDYKFIEFMVRDGFFKFDY